MTAESADTPHLKTIARDMFVREGIDNISWVDMGGYTLVIDALENAAEEKDVFAAIRQTMPSQPVSKLVNTHLHPDHTALNPRFEQQFGTEFINRDTCPEAINSNNGLCLHGEKRSAFLYPLPKCHTDKDAVVWFPQERVLFTGDLFGWGLIPCIGRLDTAAVNQLLKIYDTLIAYAADTVVPGHGPIASTKELKQCRDYFAWLTAKVKDIAQPSIGLNKILEDIPAPVEMQNWWRFPEQKHPHNIKRLAQGSLF